MSYYSDKEIYELYKRGGKTTDQIKVIAQLNNCSRQEVESAISRYESTISATGHSRGRNTKYDKQAMLECIKAQLSPGEAAAKLGVTNHLNGFNTTYYKLRKEYNSISTAPSIDEYNSELDNKLTSIFTQIQSNIAELQSTKLLMTDLEDKLNAIMDMLKQYTELVVDITSAVAEIKDHIKNQED